MEVFLRQIQPNDNPYIATIIRKSLEEFGANKLGTVYYDASTDALYQLFQTQRSVYFIATYNDEIIGGAGIFPTDGLPHNTAELVKMYIKPAFRGKGIGKKLLDQCTSWAKVNGYENVYLETMPELKKAISTYEAYGFKRLQNPLGNSGHTGCDIWMQKEL
ncbi:MAG: GNAT family N-acetyltransferase [Chitinophagaceae bacterium]